MYYSLRSEYKNVFVKKKKEKKKLLLCVISRGFNARRHVHCS